MEPGDPSLQDAKIPYGHKSRQKKLLSPFDVISCVSSSNTDGCFGDTSLSSCHFLPGRVRLLAIKRSAALLVMIVIWPAPLGNHSQLG
jgi:hypothetical protein